MLLLKQSHNDIHHGNVSSVSSNSKLCLFGGANQSASLCSPELKDFGGELFNQKERKIKLQNERKTEGQKER